MIVTEWEQFRALDLERVKAEMRPPVIVDLRNIYRRREMSDLGFRYRGRAGGGRIGGIFIASPASPSSDAVRSGLNFHACEAPWRRSA